MSRSVNKFVSTLILLLVSVFSPTTTFSEGFSDNTQTVFTDDMSVEVMAELYHTKMNEFFNGKAALLVSSKGETKPPSTEGECLSNSGGKPNISTYCTAIQSSHLYIQFRDALLKKWNNVDTDKESSLAGLLKMTEARRTMIDDQITRSKATLDMTLNAYNELRWSYALHKEYKATIGDLLKYRDNIADVRKYVEEYPSRFHDATTPYCK